MIILDTNVLSETIKPAPDSAVERWMGNQAASSLYITAITQAELLFGIEIMPEGRRRRSVSAAVEKLLEVVFRDRILSFDADAARMLALVMSERRASGRPIPQMDALIAAIARSRGATVATRDTTFELCSVTVVNPWKAAGASSRK